MKAPRSPKHNKQQSPQTLGNGVVYVTAGQWRRSAIPVLNIPGLRPTPERVRETLFNWLNHFLGPLELYTFLDMFAGSGILGIEALSRGFKSLTAIEKNKFAARSLYTQLHRLSLQPYQSFDILTDDAFNYLENNHCLFDVICIDPPYQESLQAKALQVAKTHLTPNGLLYVEFPQHGSHSDLLEQLGLCKIRSGKAGLVRYELLVLQTSSLTQYAKL